MTDLEVYNTVFRIKKNGTNVFDGMRMGGISQDRNKLYVTDCLLGGWGSNYCFL